MPKIVYHGSPNGNIKELLAHKGTHQKIVYMEQKTK